MDAATGGKTGVNLAGGKNLIGSFHHPLAVLIDPDVLATLPERELRAGLFEVLKCGVIRDSSLFELLAGRAKEVLAMSPELIDKAIADAVRIKAEVVSADEREGDLRRILNFGHTIGHALKLKPAMHDFCTERQWGGGCWPPRTGDQERNAEESTMASTSGRAFGYSGLFQVRMISHRGIWCTTRERQEDARAVKIHFVLPTAIGKA